MKWFPVSLLTFLLGFGAVSIFSHVDTSVVAVVEVSTDKVFACPIFDEEIPNEVEESRPFFDSFEEDEYFSGWLAADEFTGMKEVWTILLDNEDVNGRPRWSAMVLTKLPDGSSNDNDNFHSIQIRTKNDHLSFKTNKIHGVHYEFDGEFFKNGKDFSENEKVLNGTMRKIVKGKEVGRFTSDFAYSEPQCFH